MARRSQPTRRNKLEESNKYTVKLQGTLAPFTGDQFMASLNTLTTPSTHLGNPASKTAILPNPNLGGFTASNPPGALPKTPTEEKFGARMYVPSPYGQAFVTSQTLDVYQQTLLQTNTVYGFVRIPDPQIPRDLNIVSFRMSSKYIRPGCLDGVIGYGYNPATLPTGAQTYATSTGEMQRAVRQQFLARRGGSQRQLHAGGRGLQLKKQIDQQAFNAMALYQSAIRTRRAAPRTRPDARLSISTTSTSGRRAAGPRRSSTPMRRPTTRSIHQRRSPRTSKADFNIKVYGASVLLGSITGGWQHTYKDTVKYSYHTTGTSSFDITASFDGIETDTQMRYACNNDAHFVMNNNSTFNPEQPERAEPRHRVRRAGLQHRALGHVRRRAADVGQRRHQHDLHAAAAVLHDGQRRRV